MTTPQIPGMIDFPVGAQFPDLSGLSGLSAPAPQRAYDPIYTPPANTIPRADEYRAPVPQKVAVIDTGGSAPVVASEVTVTPAHYAPGGYFNAEHAPVTVGQQLFGPQGVEAPAPMAAAEHVPGEAPAQPALVVPQAEVEFEIIIGGESEVVSATYGKVLFQGDLVIFVSPVETRLWLPKSRESGEIVMRMDRELFKITVLPLLFTYRGEQFRFALVSEQTVMT